MTHTTEQLEAMLAAATPGPWETRGAKVGGDKAICTSKREILAEACADIRCANEMAFDECAANAALIAASPTITADLIAARKRIAELEGALRALLDLNDNHGPFGGEMYQDRIDRTWDRAHAALGEQP